MTHEPASAALLRIAHERARRVAGRLRLSLWRMEGARIAPGVRVFGRVTLIGDPRRLSIGPGSTLNEGVHLELRDRVRIGSDVHISSFVQIHTGELVPEVVPRIHRSAPILVEDHAWIAAGAVIGAGVRIGRGAVVGAGAVVVRDVPPGTFVAGVPANVVRVLETESAGSVVGPEEMRRRRFRRRSGAPER
jgi:acetyltransferase-like isoleucine patch superfamily enzyme